MTADSSRGSLKSRATYSVGAFCAGIQASAPANRRPLTPGANDDTATCWSLNKPFSRPIGSMHVVSETVVGKRRTMVGVVVGVMAASVELLRAALGLAVVAGEVTTWSPEQPNRSNLRAMDVFQVCGSSLTNWASTGKWKTMRCVPECSSGPRNNWGAPV